VATNPSGKSLLALTLEADDEGDVRPSIAGETTLNRATSETYRTRRFRVAAGDRRLSGRAGMTLAIATVRVGSDRLTLSLH
jgi:hypothetical protein